MMLHSNYPYTREAGYLSAVYKNVYLDIGEVFSMVSGGGQELLAWQALELTPTDYVMRSSERFLIASSADRGHR
jgi:predicted TIM-barrel fold metal-dependent hydrolase